MTRAKTICCERDCPNIATYRGRCPRHAREYNARLDNSTPTKVAARRERKVRRRVVERWVKTHGYICPGYKRQPHASHDLTAEHIVPVADGGSTSADNMTVLCRSCNSRHGAETANRYK